MPSLTREESVQLDAERVRFVDEVMADLGFSQFRPYESFAGPYKFTESILYEDDDTGDSVVVSFPYADKVERGFEITTQSVFNNKVKSPEWKSLYQFEEEIAFWIEECRREERRP